MKERKLNSNVNILNHLQIIKRERNLTNEEITQLLSITENENTTEMEKTAAYMLVENDKLAKEHYTMMNNIEQKSFKDYPIYHFWNIKN